MFRPPATEARDRGKSDQSSYPREFLPLSMSRRADPLSRSQHRKVGADLFNYTWSLLDRKKRTRDEDDEMLHAAHASRYHWGHAGTALNRSIAEWQISRVYAVLGRGEPALHHGRRSLEIARKNRLGRFYVAYAYEAMARASAVAGEARARDRYLREARRIGASVRDRDDRRMLLAALATIPGAARFGLGYGPGCVSAAPPSACPERLPGQGGSAACPMSRTGSPRAWEKRRARGARTRTVPRA